MHNINYGDYPENANKAMVQKYWDDVARREDWQEGCNGLGSNIRWNDVLLESREEAKEWISTHDSGWYDQLAVKYKEYPETKTKKTEELEKRILDEKNKKLAYSSNHSIHNQKSQYIGCQNCGSKLRLGLVNGNTCPLCKSDLRCVTVLKTIEKYDGKIKELEARLKEEKKKQRSKFNVCWLVKTEYHT